MKQVLALLVLLLTGIQPVDSQVANLSLVGQYGPFLRLSAGAPPQLGGRNVLLMSNVANSTVTPSPMDMENFSSSLDFGDLSKGEGEPVVGGVGLRMRSNTSFTVTMSVLAFQATNLRYRGREVDSGDGGTFITVSSGPVVSTGSNAAGPGQVGVASGLTAGMPLSAVARGQASSAATPVMSGTAASLGGGVTSADNATDLAVFLSVPSGYELGPASGSGNASFSFTLQFGAFPGS